MVKSGYRETEIGMIPENWDVKPLKAVAPLQRGFDLPYSCIEEGKYPVVFSNGVGAFHSSYMVKGPGVITGRSGTIGKIHYVESDYWPHNTALWVTDFHGNDPLYVYYLFKTVPWNLYNSGSGVPTLNRNDVHDYLVAVPSTKEQTEIATVLTDIDNLINSLEKQLSKKKAIKQGAMQELLTGKKRLPGFSGKWKSYQLRDLGEFLKGSGISRAESNTGKIPAVRYGELYTHHQNYVVDYISHVSKEVAVKAKQVFNGDILFAASGETKEEIGKCATIISQETVYAGGDILIFRPNVNLNPIFMGTLLNTADACRQRAEKGQGDAVVHIHADSLASIKIRIPEISEQDAIAGILFEMDNEIKLLEQKLAKYRQVKQGMMQQLLTGKIRLV